MEAASVWFNDTLAGRLAIKDDGYIFKYAPSYLANPHSIPIDPIHLPLESSLFHSYELFGVMRDALPDSWGRFVLAKELNLDASRISDLDCINYASSNAVGCITFSPVDALHPLDSKPLFLRDLQGDIEDMDYECSQAVARLIHAGSSMGGARPKTSVIHDGAHYLAKFNQRHDTLNVCRCEHAAMTFAKVLDVNVADTHLTQVQGKDVLMVKRFDRDNGIKYPFMSALTLSGRNERDFMHSSYVELNTLSRTITSQIYGEQWLRRMTYNVLCNNDDDHLRNHGFIARNGMWELSPAYDIMPHAMKGETYRLAIGLTEGDRTASLEHAVQAGRDMGIDHAESIVSDMQIKFGQWQSHFEQHGVPSDDINAFERMFNRFNASALKQDVSDGLEGWKP